MQKTHKLRCKNPKEHIGKLNLSQEFKVIKQ